MRFLGLDGLVLGALSCSLWAAACSSQDPGAVNFSPRHLTGGPTTDLEAGAPPVVEAGSDAGGSGTFAGSTPFKPNNTSPTINQQGHKDNGSADGTPPNTDCFSCHGPPTNKGPAFVFAGRALAKGGGPLAGAQVRVVDGTGKEVGNVYTDANGYFYCTTGTLGTTNSSGIRTATDTADMAPNIFPNTQGGCNSTGCHTPVGGDGPITLPFP